MNIEEDITSSLEALTLKLNEKCKNREDFERDAKNIMKITGEDIWGAIVCLLIGSIIAVCFASLAWLMLIHIGG